VDLALVHETALGFVDELDRILDRNDVVRPVVVTVIHHARKRGALARARGPRHQHESAREHAQVAENLRRAEIVQRQDGGGNVAEHGAGAAVLVEGVHPEAGKLGDLE
jgi:hypothetical protein